MVSEGVEEVEQNERIPQVVPIPPPDRGLPDKLDRALSATRAARRKRPWIVAVLTSRRFWFVIVLILVISASIAIPHFFWNSAPELSLKIAVLDKTVPFTDHREHRGLFWLLGQNKFVDASKGDSARWYDLDSDYYGFFPPDPETVTISESPTDKPPVAQGSIGFATEAAAAEPAEATEAAEAVSEETIDYPIPEEGEELSVNGDWRTDLLTVNDLQDRNVLYIADTYGVYTGDYLQRAGKEIERNQKIFGGLSESEVEATEWFAAQGHLIIGEFNCFASPTPKELRERTESVFGVQWTGWSGRYFVNFADRTDVPYWLMDKWEADNSRPWDLEGAGYMFVNDDTGEYLILQEDVHIERRGVELVPIERFAAEDDMQGVEPCTFCYWFDVIEAGPDVDVLADFDLHLTAAGAQLLSAHNVPLKFPAVTRRHVVFQPMADNETGEAAGDEITEAAAAAAEAGSEMEARRNHRKGEIRSNDREYLAYYMAGNMMNAKMELGPHNTRLTMYINRSFYSQPVVGSQGYFFWHTYYPMVSNILRKEANRLTGSPGNIYLFD